ncbi:MAG: hypothetical protein LC729_01045 [Acidobacteria bacterium]|nr:hypothetical protein [Acidobacteriota bacterium]
MPGPSPTYRPLFTVDQLAHAQRIAHQHQAPHALVQRAQLALLLHAQPALDNRSLATALSHHPNWAYKWRKRWTKQGFSLEDQAGRGRKPVFSPAGENYC